MGLIKLRVVRVNTGILVLREQSEAGTGSRCSGERERWREGRNDEEGKGRKAEDERPLRHSFSTGRHTFSRDAPLYLKQTLEVHQLLSFLFFDIL